MGKFEPSGGRYMMASLNATKKLESFGLKSENVVV